jgi:mRNA-degrading endonuclease RelE of RelBE toxin-antitoxin system
MKAYEIRCSKSMVKSWSKLEDSLPASTMEECRKFLQEYPLDRLKSGGKLKKLKGKLKGILQYDIDDNNRVHYEVDNTEFVVYIKYIGSHPK